MTVDLKGWKPQRNKGVKPTPKKYDSRYYMKCGGTVGMKHWDGIKLRPWYQRVFIWLKIRLLEKNVG
jgi:hypothetical protein